MMQTAHLRKRDDSASCWSLHWPRHGRIFPQPEMRSASVIVGDEGIPVAAQGPFVDNDHMIQAFAPDRADHAFNVRAPGVRRRPMYLLTLVSPTSMPSFSNSPWICGAPHSGFLSTHSSNQLTDVMRNGWASWPAVLALPRPKQPEGFAMPRDDGIRLDDDQRRSPVGPDATEPCPEESIGRGQPRSLHRALQDAHLVTECQDLKLQGRATAERQHERRADGEEHAAE